MKILKPWPPEKLLRMTLVTLLPGIYFLKLGVFYQSIFTNPTFWLFCFAYFLCFSQMLLTCKRIYVYSIDILLFTFALYIFVCTLWSPYFLAGLRKATEFMFITLPIVYFVRFFVRDKTEIEEVIKVSLFIATILVVYDLVSFVSFAKTIERTTIGMVSLGLMGLYCAVHAYSSIYFFLKAKKRSSRVYYFSAFMILAIGLVLTGARASILGLALLLCWLLLRELIKGNSFRLMVLLFFLTGSVFIINRFIPVLDYTTYRLSLIGKPQDVAGQGRIELYRGSISSICKNPLFGEGTGSNPFYAHNIFLEIGSENGAIGLILLFAVIFLFLNIKRRIKNEEVYELVVGFFMISFFVSLFSFSYYFQRYLFFSLGLILVTYHLSNRLKEI